MTKKVFTVLIPGIYFMLVGEVMIGLACLILQSTAVGWIPAIIWAQADMQRRS